MKFLLSQAKPLGAARCQLARARSVLSAALLMSAVAGCDNYSEFQRFGVSIDTDGQMTIHYVACPWELVHAVELSETGSRFDDPAPTLWRIESSDGVPGGRFAVGHEPPTFDTEVALTEDLDDHERLVASVDLEGDFGPALEFLTANLEPNQIWVTSDESVAPEAFEEFARASCPADLRSSSDP